jgi:hypothetical protein
MQTETIEKQNSAEVQFNSEPSKPDPIQQLIAIAAELRKLCPDAYRSKYGNSAPYINLSIADFGTISEVSVFYDSNCHFRVSSLYQLEAKLSEHDPEAVKRKRIETLKAELAQLETEAA